MPKPKRKPLPTNTEALSTSSIDRVASIDPGIRGALVLLNRGKIEKAILMPLIEIKDSDLGRTTVDALELRCRLQELQTEGPIDRAVIELPQFRPGHSAQAQGTTGINFGILYGALVSLEIPVTTVQAMTWTKKIHSIDKRCQAIDDTKEKAKLVFDKLYPKGWNGKPVTHDGIIDATLIGFWWLWEQGLLARYRNEGYHN